MDFLATLRLTMHEPQAQVVPTTNGIPWLGFVVYPTHRRLKRRNAMDFTRRLAHNLDLYSPGRSPLRSWTPACKAGSTTSATPIPGACVATSSQTTPSSRRETSENRFAFGEGTGRLENLRKVRHPCEGRGLALRACCAPPPQRSETPSEKGDAPLENRRCRRDSQDGRSRGTRRARRLIDEPRPAAQHPPGIAIVDRRHSGVSYLFRHHSHRVPAMSSAPQAAAPCGYMPTAVLRPIPDPLVLQRLPSQPPQGYSRCSIPF